MDLDEVPIYSDDVEVDPPFDSYIPPPPPPAPIKPEELAVRISKIPHLSKG